jgi:putative hydrolase of the HAD superfamily
VRLSKPDPAIFLCAADRLGLPPSSIMMVGDSFDRDIRPAKTVGMQTAWLEGAVGRDCPAPALADLRLRALADLPAALEQRAAAAAMAKPSSAKARSAGPERHW